MTGNVLVERHGAVQVIRMHRPEKKNALTGAMYAAMTAALKAVEGDEAIRVNVLFGVPGAFTAGNDLKDFLAHSEQDGLGTEVIDFLLALASGEKPMLAGVDGIAIGLGTTLQLHCDLTFATPRSLFRAPFTDLGIVPEAGSSLLGPLVLGRQNAFALLAMGADFTAEDALRAGLIYRIVPEEELEAATLAAAARIAAKPPEAMRLSRRLLRGDPEAVLARIREENRIFGERLKSPEAIEAFKAFFARK